MKNFINFSLGEYKKLIYQAKTKVILALTVLYAIAMGVVSFIIKNNTGVTVVSPERFPAFILEILSGLILPLFTILIVSELYAAEFKDATIKNLFALPVSKSIIYLGKIVAGAALIGTVILTLGISGLVMNVAINGSDAFSGIGMSFISYSGTFIFLTAVLFITAFFTLLTASPNIAVVMNLMIWFVMGLAGTFLAPVRQYLPTGFTQWYQPLVNGTNATTALPTLIYMLSYCVIFAVAGLIIFERKEV